MRAQEETGYEDCKAILETMIRKIDRSKSDVMFGAWVLGKRCVFYRWIIILKFVALGPAHNTPQKSVWKRWFHSNAFRPHCSGERLSGLFGFVLKKTSVRENTQNHYTKTQKQRFQIPAVRRLFLKSIGRSFSKSSVFVTDLCAVGLSFLVQSLCVDWKNWQ